MSSISSANSSSVSVTPSPIVIDPNNTTTIPLAAGAAFVGAATDILNYVQINITMFARPNIPVSGDAVDAMATFIFEFSKDAVNWDVFVPSLIRTPGIVIPIPLISVGRYFRATYLNDGGALAIAIFGLDDVPGTPTAQTVFRLQTYLLPIATTSLLRTIDQSISGSDGVTVGRNVIMGKTPSLTYVNLAASGISAPNTSVTPLAASATFTGRYINVEQFAGVTVACLTDQAGSLLIDNSNNGSTIVRTSTFPVLAATPFFIALTPLNKHLRVRYINGAIAQGSLNLQVIAKSSIVSPTIQALNTTLFGASIATNVRAVLAGSKADGSFNNVAISNVASLKTSIEEVINTDIPSAAYTTTFNTASFTLDGHSSLSVDVDVTAVSGTLPTLDLILQSSIGQTSWRDIIHLDRLTTVSFLSEPPIGAGFSFYRWRCIIGGTLPSFTFSAVVSRHSYLAFPRRSYNQFNAIDLAVLGATSPSVEFKNATTVCATIFRSGGTGSAQIILQVSNDNTQFTDIGNSVLTLINGTINFVQASIAFKYYRFRVTNASLTASSGEIKWNGL